MHTRRGLHICCLQNPNVQAHNQLILVMHHASYACTRVEDSIFVAFGTQASACIHELVLVVHHASYACIRVEDCIFISSQLMWCVWRIPPTMHAYFVDITCYCIQAWCFTGLRHLRCVRTSSHPGMATCVSSNKIDSAATRIISCLSGSGKLDPHSGTLHAFNLTPADAGIISWSCSV